MSFEQAKKNSSHFADSEQVKKLVVIMPTLNKSKIIVILLTLNKWGGSHFADFEQVKRNSSHLALKQNSLRRNWMFRQPLLLYWLSKHPVF